MVSRRTLAYEGQDPQRLDHFLAASLPEFSRSRLQALIREGCVMVGGRQARKTGQAISPGDVVEVDLPPVRSAGLIPESIPLDVIYESEDVLAVSKPAGMVVHPAAGHDTGTLVHAALAHAPDIAGIGGELRPGVVHRLDKDTSGLILLAKNDRAHRFLQEQFRDRTVRKIYLALVDGAPPTPEGRVEAEIGRDLRNRKRMAVVPTGKGRQSATLYRTLETFPEHTLLEANPETGRTHQIRVHLAFIGCPVAGDMVYGRKKRTLRIKRHFLHAARITIRMPGEPEARELKAPLPENLSNLLADLRRKAGPAWTPASDT